jgi:hypothetical protein
MARGTASRSVACKTSSAAAGRGEAAMTDLPGKRHIMIPAGAPWSA